MTQSSRWDRYLGMTAPMTQVPVPTAMRQPVTAQQLAHQSGFRSYITFSAAFKQIMGKTATEWMRNIEEQE